MLRVSFALSQRLHLYLQLIQLALQGLLGFLHRHLVLQGGMKGYTPELLPTAAGRSFQTTALVTLLACSSCSLSSSNAWLCFCLMSAICCSCTLASSSRVLFSWATSVSRLDLDGEERLTSKGQVKGDETDGGLQRCSGHLSSCCAAVVSRVSSSSVFRASSSSPRSLRCFSALERACLSSSRSSWSSEICASSSLIFFWAVFFAAASSSILNCNRGGRSRGCFEIQT